MPPTVPPSFLHCESGAVTVDMTVITGGVVGLGLAVMAVVQPGVGDLGGYVGDQMTDMMDVAVDHSAYAMLGGNHDDSWRAALAARVASFNDNRLTRGYNNTYQRALSGTRAQRANRIDRLGVFEAEMIARGLPIPDGNRGFAELHAEWVAEFG